MKTQKNKQHLISAACRQRLWGFQSWTSTIFISSWRLQSDGNGKHFGVPGLRFPLCDPKRTCWRITLPAFLKWAWLLLLGSSRASLGLIWAEKRATGHNFWGISILSSHPEKFQITLVRSDRVLKLQYMGVRNNRLMLTTNTLCREQWWLMAFHLQQAAPYRISQHYSVTSPGHGHANAFQALSKFKMWFYTIEKSRYWSLICSPSVLSHSR